MPEGFILIYGAAVFAPSLLFAILIWNGVACRVETSARARSVMACRLLREMPAQTALPTAPAASEIVARTAA